MFNVEGLVKLLIYDNNVVDVAFKLSIFNNLNNLSSQSHFLTNYTNLSNLNVSGTTKLNGAATCMPSLNVSGITTLSNKLLLIV